VEAVHHARKHFVMANMNATQMLDVQKSMVLLAYVKSTEASTYQVTKPLLNKPLKLAVGAGHRSEPNELC
jgi:hypothetical protein